MKTNKSIFAKKNVPKKFWVFLFMIPFSFLNAQDTLDYGLNDPRNPKCPCHKYQKIADEEYKKITASAKGTSSASSRTNSSASHSNENLNNVNDNNVGLNSNVTNGTGNISNGSSSGSDKISNKKRSWYTKHRHKKRNKKYDSLRKVFDVKHWDIWKEIIDPSSCYHWK
jgi:hypothetical protein